MKIYRKNKKGKIFSHIFIEIYDKFILKLILYKFYKFKKGILNLLK